MFGYYNALDLFKSQDHKTLVEKAICRLINDEESIKNSKDLLKLADLTLRTCILSKNLVDFERILGLVKGVESLSHFHAAKYFHEGNDDKAWYYLSKCVPHDADLHSFPSLGLNSIVRSKDWLKFSEDNDEVFVFDGDIDSSGKDVGVVFSCDAGYFKRFFESSLKSLRDKSKNYLALYLVINPDDEVLELAENYLGDDVKVLYFYSEAMRGGKSYYASARFYAAKFLMEKTGLPSFVFDIDTFFDSNIKDFFLSKEFDANKINMRISNVLSLPWHKIPAGFLYVPNNNYGYEFIKNVCKFFDGIFNRSSIRNLWWIDQNALFFAYKSMPIDSFKSISGVLLNSQISYPKMFANKDEFMAAKK